MSICSQARMRTKLADGAGRSPPGPDAQLLGQIQRHHAGRLVQVELWAEPHDRHLQRMAGADRVGGLGVLEIAGGISHPTFNIWSCRFATVASEVEVNLKKTRAVTPTPR